MDLQALTEVEFLSNPVLFVELVHAWAAGEAAPTAEQEQWLSRMDRPVIIRPADARTALWGCLSYPERGRSLAWLDRYGLLDELIPSWSGDSHRQGLRIQAVEEVHLEHWSRNLSKTSFDWLCVYMDQKVDGRLGGWALTGLAALLLSGDEPAGNFASRVAADLKALGASAGERERVVMAIREYPGLYDAIMSGQLPKNSCSPTAVIATISTVFVIPRISTELCDRASQFADKLLLKFAAPEQGS
jgi:hypothetical protein